MSGTGTKDKDIAKLLEKILDCFIESNVGFEHGISFMIIMGYEALWTALAEIGASHGGVAGDVVTDAFSETANTLLGIFLKTKKENMK